MDDERNEQGADIDSWEPKGSPRSNEVRVYLNYIRNMPPLTQEEECALAEKMRIGRRAAARLLELEQDGRVADPDEAEECVAAIRAGDWAKRRLAEGYLRFAAYFAMRFRNRGIAVIDLIQEANIALVKAADSWSYDHEHRFAAYATPCIKGTLKNSCARVSVIHVSSWMNNAVKKVNQIFAVMKIELGRVPAPKEIAQELNISADIVADIMAASRLSLGTTSLDAPLTEDGDVTLANFTSDRTAPDPEMIVTATILHEKMDAVLHTLEPGEEKVIRLRFGFEDGAVHSLQDVATACSSTLEETQRMEIKALRKLRHPSRSAQFVGFLE